MAESVQGIQNKWLLIIAVVLGLVVVFLYNAHIHAIRSELEGKTVAVVQLAKDLPAGERITARHIKKAVIPKDNAEAYGKIVPWKHRDYLTAHGGKPIHRALRKDQYLLYDYIDDAGGDRASQKLGDGMVAIPVEFDRNQSLGDMLAPGDTVNLKGVFASPGGTYRTYRILSDVRVMNIGGVGAADDAGRTNSRIRTRNYRQITIEVTPDVSLKLSNLKTHMIGDFQLEINQAGAGMTSQPGQINPELNLPANQAKPAGRMGTPMTVPPRSGTTGR
ncbi:MAG: hypothetical protein JXA11_05990 [Phycisphaerae bacterium]|nr:hypothetical protein [Phycisphaerae bacterium]